MGQERANSTEQGLTGLVSHFDARASNFVTPLAANGYAADDDTMASHRHYDIVLDEILGFMPIGAADRFLEIGCGTGELLARIARRAATARGAEISSGMAAASRARGLAVDLYDGRRLPYPDSSFDKILVFSVIINIPAADAIDALIADALRILAPGGTLMIGSTPHPARSVFPTHATAAAAVSWRGRLAALVGRTPPPIGCFSVPVAAFEKFLAFPGVDSLRAAWPRSSYNGSADRYHVAISRGR